MLKNVAEWAGKATALEFGTWIHQVAENLERLWPGTSLPGDFKFWEHFESGYSALTVAEMIGDPEEGAPMFPCECEHEVHFLAEVETHNPEQKVDAHFYMGRHTTTYPIKTPWGTFNVCRECATTCYKEYSR